MHAAPLISLAALVTWSVVVGCAEVSKKMDTTWHEKCGWKAEDHFDDPQVIALCHAIEANDLAEIDRLVVAGANVNALGKGNMTPLLWAYPDNKLGRFKRILEHGADPNVIIQCDFNSHGGMRAGDSVTHMACKTAFPGYFEAVFYHGGDPNLIKNGLVSNETPLFTLIMGNAPNKTPKVRLLIEKGANINHSSGTGTTPVRLAVGWGGQYDIALVLLEAGANHRVYKPKENSRLVHAVIEQDRLKETWTSQQKSDYQKLMKWLEDHGESIEEARADKKRWASWNLSDGEFRRKMDAEIASRKTKEAREKAAAAKKVNPNDE